MIKVLSLICILLASHISYAEELSPAKKKVIDEMLEITGALRMAEMMGNAAAGQMVNALRAQSKTVDAKTVNVIKDEMSSLMHEEFIANGFMQNLSYDIYHKHFTLAELEKIVAFYKTEVGNKLAANLPQITQEAMQKGQQHGMSLGPKMQQRLMARFAKEGIALP